MKNPCGRAGLGFPMSCRIVSVALAISLASACSGDTAAGPMTTTTVTAANTVAGVGRLPSTIPEVTFPEDVADGFVLPALEGVPVGREIGGNRVLLIGDSIFAGTSPRHSDTACRQLVPLGWQVAVEAESGRFAEFGARVARRRAGEGWDAVVVFIGSNYDGGRSRYERDMTAMLDQFADVPVVLVTTTVFRSTQRQVNEVIRDLAAQRDDARVIEWAEISQERRLLSGDGLHPNADGQVVLTAAVAQVLGEAPIDEGRCLESLFTDDSTNPDGPRSGGSSATNSATNSATSSPGSSVTTSATNPADSATTSASPDTSVEDDDGDASTDDSAVVDGDASTDDTVVDEGGSSTTPATPPPGTTVAPGTVATSTTAAPVPGTTGAP